MTMTSPARACSIKRENGVFASWSFTVVMLSVTAVEGLS